MKCITIGGTIATYSSTVIGEPTLPFRDMMFMDLTVRMVIVYAMPESAKQAAVEDTVAALREGKLEHRIAHVLPLEDIARSHELIEQGGFGGCVVVQIAQSDD
jgi:NADPH:quinone reductase